MITGSVLSTQKGLVSDGMRLSFSFFLPSLFLLHCWMCSRVEAARHGGGAVKHLALIPTLITLFFPAFMEELGWRGYALDRLQWRWSALVSSLILGILWAFWHTPLFFFKDTIMYNMGFGSLAFWTFIISTICPTIYLTWIFNNTNRSTLSGILWHAWANGWAALFTLTALASHYLGGFRKTFLSLTIYTINTII